MAGQTARKAAKANPADPGPPLRKPRLHSPTLVTFSAAMRTPLLKLCLLVIVVVMVPVVALQFTKAQVIIDTFDLPAALTQRGLAADVVANRLWGWLVEVKAAAASSKEGGEAIPSSQPVDFRIPDFAISIDSLMYYVRQFFHLYQTRISGEFVCADAACAPEGMALRVRVLREKLAAAYEVKTRPQVGGRGVEKIRASTLLALNRPQDALVQLQPLLADPMKASLTLMHG